MQDIAPKAKVRNDFVSWHSGDPLPDLIDAAIRMTNCRRDADAIDILSLIRDKITKRQ